MDTTSEDSPSARPNGFARSVQSNSGDIVTISGNPPSSLPNGSANSINIQSDSTRPALHLLSKPQLCLDLYKAAVEGDVKKGRKLIEGNPELLSAAITEEHQTVLHVAAGAKQSRFVKNMINLNSRDNTIELQLQDKKNYTAFCYAAMAGSKEIARIMLQKDEKLLTIRGGSGENRMTPLYLAVLFGHREMASYLYKEMKKRVGAKDELEKDEAAIVFASIDNTLYDFALTLLNDDKRNEVATAEYTYGDKRMSPLYLLARTPLHLLHQSSQSDKTALLKKAIDFFRKNHKKALLKKALELVKLLSEKKLEQEGKQARKYFEENKKLLFDAAHLGNYEFLAKLIRLYPDLGLLQDEGGQSLFHIAIVHRNRNLFGLIYEMGFEKQLVATYLDKEGNSILHLAAKYPNESPDQIRGPEAALELQRELKLFKEVEKLVMPSYIELTNSEGKTPREVFKSSHAGLSQQGETWMRKTAESCMLVATLITTVVFAAAFSLPGGNDQVKGIPIQLRKTVFSIFSIVDAVALSASSISILIFWSILLSHYEEKDFLTNLPLKLVYGLSTLFISVASMMVAFGSSFFLAYSQGRITPIPILIAIIVCLPIILFVLLQYRLLKEVFYSSFRYRFSIKLKKC